MLDRVEPGGYREVSYRVRSDLRGRYPLGPLQLRLTDPFGMCELTRSFSATDTLTVVPRVEALPPVRLAGEGSGYGESRTRALALAGEDDVIPRGYRHGDDLRRVHWRSTARYGELMVRREEQPHRARCTVLLDTRRIAYHGAGPGLGVRVGGDRRRLGRRCTCWSAATPSRLLTDTGTCVPGPDGTGGSGGDSSDAAGTLLDTLAVVGHSDGAGLSRGVRRAARRPRGRCWWPSSANSTRSRRRSSAGCGSARRARWPSCWTATLGADRRRPSRRAEPDERCGMLREAGWTALLVRPGDDARRAVAAGRPYRSRGTAARHEGDDAMSGLGADDLCAALAALLAACSLLPLASPMGWFVEAVVLVGCRPGWARWPGGSRWPGR